LRLWKLHVLAKAKRFRAILLLKLLHQWPHIATGLYRSSNGPERIARLNNPHVRPN
jgi:hypothetical protein